MITLKNGSEKVKLIIYYILTICALFFIAISLYYIYFINGELQIKIIGTIISIFIILLLLYIDYKVFRRKRNANYTSPIHRFILMTGDGGHEKEWYCEGMHSYLIGKGSLQKDVDMELGDTHFAEYISTEHAVLNYSEGFWYIEDLESINGVGIKKRNEEYALRIKPLTAYKIDEGDIIYISKAKILVR